MGRKLIEGKVMPATLYRRRWRMKKQDLPRDW